MSDEIREIHMRMSYRSIDIRGIRSWSASKIMMAIMLSTIVTAGYTTGCKSQISATLVQGTKSSASSSGLKPITAKPGETVTLSGVGFKSSQKNVVKITTASGSVVTAQATVLSDTAATFVMPDGAGLGLTSVVLESNGKQMSAAMSFVANLASNALDIFIGDADKVCSTITYIDRNGDTQTGTKDCASGGTECTAEGQTLCKLPSTYLSAAAAKVIPGNIKSGISIAGVTGNYPSASSPLPGATTTADLTLFTNQVTSAGTFEFWDSAGNRSTGSGDADITASNIKAGVDFENFSLTGTSSPDLWDLRMGSTFGNVTGKLKTTCRNRARSAVYNYDGAVGSILNFGDTTGTLFDYWDTIDDYNNNVAGLPTSIITGWDNYDCGGVEATAGDANVWKDITTTGDGFTASTCTATAAHCTMKDKITGLQWSKFQNASQTWSVAINTCDALNFNGATDWRLPTQKELMEAYAHSVRSAASANWITEVQMAANNFWSASSVSTYSSDAWKVYLPGAAFSQSDKWDPYQVVCVR